MTLIITVYCKEGIVMASDSLTTYDSTESPVKFDDIQKQIVQHGIHFTDTTYKTFVTANSIGISTCWASCINNSPITGYIEAFVRDNAKTSIDNLPLKLRDYFKTLDPNLDTIFHVAGYEKGSALQKMYVVTTKSGAITQTDLTNAGASWSGERDVVTKLVIPVAQITGDEKTAPIPNYEILWQYFTLQDAIDFAEYAIKTTIDTMKIQKRVKTVGGPIDILVIKPEGAQWMAHKELHV